MISHGDFCTFPSIAIHSRYENTRREAGVLYSIEENVLLGLGGHETRLAEDRASTLAFRAGLERDLAGSAALGADRVEHLAVATHAAAALVLASVAAGFAALGSRQVALGIERLFAFGEVELCTAVAALDLLISHKAEKKKRK